MIRGRFNYNYKGDLEVGSILWPGCHTRSHGEKQKRLELKRAVSKIQLVLVSGVLVVVVEDMVFGKTELEGHQQSICRKATDNLSIYTIAENVKTQKTPQGL